MNFIRVTILSVILFISTGTFAQKYLGVVLANAYDNLGQKCVAIDKVLDESPASYIGLERGDVIMKVSNKWVHTQNDLLETIKNAPDGKPMLIQILRNGKTEIKSFIPYERKHYCTEIFSLNGKMENDVAIWEFSGSGIIMKIEKSENFHFSGNYQAKTYNIETKLDNIDLKNPELFPIKDKLELLIHLKSKYNDLYQQLLSGSPSLRALKFRHFYPETKTTPETSILDKSYKSLVISEPNVYPNPTQGKVMLDPKNWLSKDVFTLHVISMNGDIVKQIQYGSDTFNQILEFQFGNVAPGMYVIMLTQGARQFSSNVYYQP